jgi:hypothetical protein
MAKFAGQLDSYIKQAGLPLRRVASQAGIPHQTLFNWLKGTQPRWHAALPRDLHRLGARLGLADQEITHLLRLAGCISARSGLFDVQEAPMKYSFRLPKGWTVSGDAPYRYEMGLDTSVTYENRPCVTIRPVQIPPNSQRCVRLSKPMPITANACVSRPRCARRT